MAQQLRQSAEETFGMTALVKRPAVTLGPGKGLFRNDQFQIAYATTDIERACAIFSDRYGIKEYRRLEGQMPAGGHVRLEIAWAGGVMYELICAQGPGSDIFRRGLPAEGFAIRHHHLGYFVRDRSGWEALEKEIDERGWPVASKTDIKGFLKAYIIDAPELGHYLEYIFPEAGGIAFFEGAPAS
jgi:hypothetical protein